MADKNKKPDKKPRAKPSAKASDKKPDKKPKTKQASTASTVSFTRPVDEAGRRKKGRPRGRAPGPTLELQREAARLLAEYGHVHVVCGLIGISRDTWHRWRRRGKQEGAGQYWEWQQAVDQARAQCQATLIERIHMAASVDWRAAAWSVERMHAGFQEKKRVDVAGVRGRPLETRRAEDLTDDQLAGIIAGGTDSSPE